MSTNRVEIVERNLDAFLESRLHAAWTGRAAGCLLGKPVEGWHTPKLHEFLRATDSFPLRGYLRRGDDPALQDDPLPGDVVDDGGEARGAQR